jgi:hypothetical protein
MLPLFTNSAFRKECAGLLHESTGFSARAETHGQAAKGKEWGNREPASKLLNKSSFLPKAPGTPVHGGNALSVSDALHDLASSIRSGLRCVPVSSDTGKRAPNSNLETGIASWGRPEDRSNRPPRHQPHPKQLPLSPLGSIGYNRSNLPGHLGKIG